MPKASREHAPGCIIHITARTQGHHPWFTESLRTRVAFEIGTAARAAGTMLIADAIMPNHFHIVVRQGACPLAFMMHRVMHRTALMLKQTHKLQGHVFERRYWSCACTTPQYVRRAIVYTHLNPWRAKLCSDPAEYKWSSHALYVMANEARSQHDNPVAALEGLRFFAHAAEEDDALRQYLDHVAFQMAYDRFLRGEIPASKLVAPKDCTAGDDYWFDRYGAAVQLRTRLPPKRPLFDVASKVLAQLDPQCPLDVVRTNSRCREVAALRRNLIAAFLASGYTGVEIARFMGITPSAVAAVSARLRN